MATRTHSSDTLVRGEEAVHLKDTSGSRKRDLEIKIKEQPPCLSYVLRKESQDRIAAIRRKMSNQANGVRPEAGVAGILKALVSRLLVSDNLMHV